MKKEYDLASLKGRKNPYARHLKRQITIRIASDTIDYFKTMADTMGVPYQNLIDSYLSDCVKRRRRISMKWD